MEQREASRSTAAARFAPGDPQTLHVNGDYLQNSGGILRIE